jgi:hypothetical protein
MGLMTMTNNIPAFFLGFMEYFDSVYIDVIYCYIHVFTGFPLIKFFISTFVTKAAYIMNWRITSLPMTLCVKINKSPLAALSCPLYIYITATEHLLLSASQPIYLLKRRRRRCGARRLVRVILAAQVNSPLIKLDMRLGFSHGWVGGWARSVPALRISAHLMR